MRRGNGEGSLYRRKEDGVWVAAVIQPSGARRVYYGRTRQQVQQKLQTALHDVQAGLPLPQKGQTTSQFLSAWIAGARSTVRASTWERYATLVAKHAVPNLGRVPLSRLGPEHLQQLYADRLAAGAAPASVRQLHAVLHRALAEAVRWRQVQRNVASLVRAPRVTRTEMRVLSPEQVRAFVASVAGTRHEALYVLALTSGMRQGELLGLRWSDVSLDARTASVQQTLYRAKGGGYSFQQPKTPRSRRQVALTAIAVAALRRHRVQQHAARLMSGELWADLDLVFANEEGRPMRGTRVTHTFQDALARAELPRIRFHDCRHTAASLMLGRGVHPKIASEMLGHATVAVTLDLYSHVTPTMQRGAADELDAALAP